MHGGKTPTKSGLYSKYPKTRLKQRIDELRKDPELHDLDQDIASIRALQEEVMGRLDAVLAVVDLDSPGLQIQPQPIPLDAVDALRQLHETVGRLIERRTKLAQGGDRMIPLEAVDAMLQAFSAAVTRYVHDDAAKRGLVETLSSVADFRPAGLH